MSGEGELCPEGSFATALNLTETTATVILSQSLGGVQTAGCKLTFELEVPEGLTLGMPTTILRGVALDRTRLERRYAFEDAGASDAFIEEPPEDFVIQDLASGLEAPSCGGVRRVRYSVDVTAQVQAQNAFFQLDSVDVDTSFRFGTDYRFCDPNRSLEIAPGERGEFCDGPQAPLRRAPALRSGARPELERRALHRGLSERWAWDRGRDCPRKQSIFLDPQPRGPLIARATAVRAIGR